MAHRLPCCEDRVWPQVERLLECLNSVLDECDAPVCRSNVQLGTDAVLDVCCAGCKCEPGETPSEGQAWVRVDSITPSYSLGVPISAPTKCPPHPLTVRVELGLARCAHTMDDQGNPPCAADVTADAMKLSRDAHLLRQAVDCCFSEGLDCDTYYAGDWTPLPVSGGCMGGTIFVDFMVLQRKCRREEED